jgi:GTP-binding protein
MHSEFITSCATVMDFPDPSLPEIAFIGRSNSGKSTLLNALAGHKSLARTGSTPGQTRLINFFRINGKKIFVDLPGYGYAKGKDAIRANWPILVDSYLQRPSLEEFLFLMDARRSLDEEDVALLRQLQQYIDPVIILTKADKMSRNEQRAVLEKAKSQMHAKGIGCRATFLVSTLTKLGIAELAEYLNLASQTNPP